MGDLIFSLDFSIYAEFYSVTMHFTVIKMLILTLFKMQNPILCQIHYNKCLALSLKIIHYLSLEYTDTDIPNT